MASFAGAHLTRFETLQIGSVVVHSSTVGFDCKTRLFGSTVQRFALTAWRLPMAVHLMVCRTHHRVYGRGNPLSCNPLLLLVSLDVKIGERASKVSLLALQD